MGERLKGLGLKVFQRLAEDTADFFDERAGPPQAETVEHTPSGRTFVRSPDMATRGGAFAWLIGQGARLVTCRVFRGPDGRWRGSGEVTGG